MIYQNDSLWMIHLKILFIRSFDCESDYNQYVLYVFAIILQGQLHGK